MRRASLPFKITQWDGKKEKELELEKAIEIAQYKFEIHNMLVQKLYEKNN